jgi:hypothetical protein
MIAGVWACNGVVWVGVDTFLWTISKVKTWSQQSSLGSMHDNILMINIIPKHFPSLVRNYIRQPHTPFKEQHYTCVIFVVLGGYVDQKEARVRGRREKRWESCLAVLSKSSSEATPQWINWTPILSLSALTRQYHPLDNTYRHYNS